MVVQGDLVLPWIAHQLGSASLPFLPVGLDDAVKILLDDKPLHRMAPWHNRAFWVVCVVKHPEDDPGHRVHGVLCVGRRCERRQVVLQSFTEDAVKGKVGS